MRTLWRSYTLVEQPTTPAVEAKISRRVGILLIWQFQVISKGFGVWSRPFDSSPGLDRGRLLRIPPRERIGKRHRLSVGRIVRLPPNLDGGARYWRGLLPSLVSSMPFAGAGKPVSP